MTYLEISETMLGNLFSMFTFFLSACESSCILALVIVPLCFYALFRLVFQLGGYDA